MIRNSHCKHRYQDKKYGKFKRVFNIMMNGKIKCTVCGFIKVK